MAALIDIRDIHKSYRLGELEIQALAGVSFTIERGEFVAIMGASGSGKSTLMNLLGCLDQPTRGTYLLDGVEIACRSEPELAAIRSRKIGFIFQSFNLLPRATALENVELPLFYSTRDRAGRARARQLLGAVGLAGREENHPNQLSGGQQQRVAIARALVNCPAILLADEPTGNLDSQNSAEIMELVTRLNRQQRLTIVLVTHEPDIAAYAQRVITFRDGCILSDVQTSPAPAPAEVQEPVAGPRPGAEDVATLGLMALTAAQRALRRNKLRAALTILGVFVGVAAVVAMVAVGEGARTSVSQKIQSLGTNLLIVLPGTTTVNGVHAGSGSNSMLTVADAQAIAREGDAFESVTFISRQVAQVVNGNRNWSTSVTGTGADYLKIRDWPVQSGRGFTDGEARRGANVCLLGQTVVKNLYADSQDPVDTAIRIKNVPMRVVGVLAPKGQSNTGHDQDDVVLVPFETAERKVLGVATAVAVTDPESGYNPSLNYASKALNVFGSTARITGKVHAIYAKTISADRVELGIEQITETLRRQHHLTPGKDDDFTVRNLQDIAQASEGAARILTLLLAAVASISLLVGGIGIMNIMLVSVTERTREIGIRIAIGARRHHILFQFLIEAILLSTIGGLAGTLLGVIASNVISIIANWPTSVSWTAIVGSFAFSAIIGVFFGYYPARQASFLNPIEALRYE